jgi:hypothetical protein
MARRDRDIVEIVAATVGRGFKSADVNDIGYRARITESRR